MRSDCPKILLLAVVVGIAGCGDIKVATNDAEKPEAQPTVFNTAGAPTIQFSVPDMMCEESCGKAVHDTLAAQPGAVEVQVDFPNRLATVAIETGKFDSQAALAALLDKQFSEAKLVGAEEETAQPAAESTEKTAE